MVTDQQTVILRKPVPSDGAKVWEFIREAGSLDLNSSYCYMMLCDYFQDTCVVAVQEGRIIGYTSAFRHQAQQDTLFVWQIGVDQAARRLGLGLRMLEELLSRESCQGVRWIEATVGPSNKASQGLFERLAYKYGTELRLGQGYPESWFPVGTAHEEELLLRLGPIRRNLQGE